MTTYALRCIDKAGGIDAYLLAMPAKQLAADPFAAKARANIVRKLERILPEGATLGDVAAAEAAVVAKYATRRG